MTKEEFIKLFSEIKSNDIMGLFGYAVMELDEEDGYKDIGKNLYNLIADSTQEELDIIEKTLCCITGWDLDSLLQKMMNSSDYYDSL